MESRVRDSKCTLCELGTNCNTVCMQPEGPQNAKIFMVGQWPQDEDDNAKRGFVGDAGRKLMYLLGKAGLRRKDIFLTHLVRCNPKKATPKKKPHIDPCLPYLLHEIKTHQPKIILTLGDKPTKAILGSNIKLKEWAGFPIWHTFDIDGEEYDCWVMPMHSPLAALNSWELDSIIVRDLEVAQRYANGEKVYKTPNVPYTLIESPAQLKELLCSFPPNSRITIDTETTGLSHATDKIIDIGFYDGLNMAYILPLLDQFEKKKWDMDDLYEYAEIIYDFLTDTKCRIGGQNFKYDLLMLGMWIIKTLGLDMFNAKMEVPRVWDVGSMHHVLDENKPHNLTFMLKWFFYWDKYDHVMDQYKGSKRGKPKKKKEVNYAHAPNKLRYEYLARDLKGTHDLAELLEPQVYAQGLGTVYETEVGLTNYLLPPQLIGIRFDKEKTEELVAINQERAKKSLDFLRQVHHTMYGQTEKPFNPNSQKQLGKLLQDVGAALKKRTKSGAVSTGKNVLKYLATQDDPIVKEVAEHVQTLRNANKLLSTYLNGNTVDCSSEDGEIKEQDKGFLPFVDPDDRVRPTYNIALTVTGRLSANDPPLQTIPRKGDLRAQIVPDNEDSVFLSCDYGKIELCVLAWCANDDLMATELINGVDLHAKTVIGVDLKRPPTDEEFERLLPQYQALPDWKQKRALGKAVSFGEPVAHA